MPISSSGFYRLKTFLSLIIVVLLAGCAVNPTTGQRIADIRWTTHGIPHIQANNEVDLGYGIGYAYARDNACLLAQEVVTVRGERSRFFGAEGKSSAGLNNLASDIFYTWLNTDDEIDTFWREQPEPIQQLLTGYAEGFNHYLAELTTDTISCQGEAWLKSIATHDLVRLVRSLLVEGGVKQFVGPLVTARPPEPQQNLSGRADATQMPGLVGFDKEALWDNKAFGNTFFGSQSVSSLGSNAIAVGKARSSNGNGLLLANPHFPWGAGAQRFYQMHLTIPGELDVMGAALPGLPLINIGFNQHVAWTHTVDTSSHFTLYRLMLDPDNSMRYIVDGESRPLRKNTLEVTVKGEKGLSTVKRDIYESEYGPVIVIPDMLEWNKAVAFVLRDANRENTRVLAQWYAVNQAQSSDALRENVAWWQGIPWVNTVAVDSEGKALYMNQSVVPNVTVNQLSRCADPALLNHGLVVLDGSVRQCDWVVDERAVQPGIVPTEELPVLMREDYVQNSNDSAWLSNPSSPLSGFSPLVSRSILPLGLRARFALSRLQQPENITPSELQGLVIDNQVYLADLIMDDLLNVCRSQNDGEAFARACARLAQWDGKANLNSGSGLLLFMQFAEHFVQIKNSWRVPFDSNDPVNTPRGINLNNPAVVKAVITELVAVEKKLEESGLRDNIRWGDIQVAGNNDHSIPIPGSYGELGVYNVIESKREGEYYRVKSGSSYIQLVEFTDGGPQAQGLLTYSQSSDPLSEHFLDQTELFSRQYWPKLPFTEAQIRADPALESKTLWKQ
ncbi:bifunctional acylase PvdQ [Oceanobacter antarcticus]|uniref:Acylase n=1 Tax=Oceanobacter antarcticus TaxID=3133425 RepID=A0ABW8NNA6_9GAMM